MTLAAASGPPGPGTGPSPLSSLFSDRVGQEHADGGSAATSVDPLSRVLRTLDTISAAELEGGPDLRTVVEAPPVGVGDPVSGGRTAEKPAVSSRREAILDAAAALFAERGYHGASLRDISREVGISHPGMLHHFSSKEALLGAVVDRLEAHAQGLLDSVEVLQSSPQSLVAALAGPWDPREHSMALLATLSAEVVNPDHPGRFRIARLRLVHEHVLEQVLAGLAANGRLVEGSDPKFLARTLFSLLLGLTVRERTVRELQKAADGDPIADVQAFVQQLVTG
ncbi:TetR family transcriptional regulator [Brachybacterium vulturis]|uniref:TetR family transcriptional regulator n=1 Tax=Brachybacterium vulturis TaxID=2017484 RepID=A0A291GLB4_9MICO|nr:TetR/AcrR family transcriptional regulator [Brachybacterium vulturis]ATG50852.1 TetR family transcriptional regulator [Brachybacterium vulturis]